MSLFWYLLVMAGVTYLIRMLPLTLLQKKIRNRRLQSFLYYVPYACLSAFPAILSATESPVSAAAALVVALVVALAGKGLVTVAACACATVFLVERLLPLLPF